MGRFATMADAQGAVFALFHSSEEGPPPAPMGTPGHVAWNELNTSDWEAAWPLYSELFGWTKDETMDMGELGIYQIIARDGAAFGAMMNVLDPSEAPAWLFYVAVESVEATKARVEDAGGTVLHGPHPVPGEQWILVGQDPQGARFAVVGAK